MQVSSNDSDMDSRAARMIDDSAVLRKAYEQSSENSAQQEMANGIPKVLQKVL